MLEICALTDTLIFDEDGLYDPRHFNDRLLLGLKGAMSEAKLHVIRARMIAWQRLPKLLQGPLRRRVGGDVVMKDSPGAQFHDHKYIKDAEAGRDDHEESHATIALAWLRTNVSQRCFGSGSRRGPPLFRYFPTVRGETRIPSFIFSSLAMRSSPQMGFSAAIFRIRSRRSPGKRGLPVGLDFQRQKSRNPLRCQRSSVSAFTSRIIFTTGYPLDSAGPNSLWLGAHIDHRLRRSRR